MNHKNFDWGYFLKHIAIIAVPVALQNLLTTTGSMVDTIMLASIGEKAVGAVGLCAQFSSLMFAGYWGFVGGGMLFFSQYWGASQPFPVNPPTRYPARQQPATVIAYGICVDT